MIFYNGTVVARSEGAAQPQPVPFVVGNGRINGGEFFIGKLRQVRISRGARYLDEFSAPWSLKADSATELLYDAAHANGPTVYDVSGRGNHGMMQGVRVE